MAKWVPTGIEAGTSKLATRLAQGIQGMVRTEARRTNCRENMLENTGGAVEIEIDCT